MTTQTRPDVDLLESLDFEPVCEWTDPKCSRTASWFGEPPCKCDTKLACAPHKVGAEMEPRPYLCRFCSTSFKAEQVAWRPL